MHAMGEAVMNLAINWEILLLKIFEASTELVCCSDQRAQVLCQLQHNHEPVIPVNQAPL